MWEWSLSKLNFIPVFFTGVWKSFVKWIALVPYIQGGRGREVSNSQRMSLGSFSRYVITKHGGNTMNKYIMRSNET